LIKKGIDTVIHVDAASGGFVAPFVVPELEWDFRLEKVVSINVSGHKYGLVRAIQFLVKKLQLTVSGLSRCWLDRLAPPRIPP
jgi:hypothetical protein